MNREEGEEEEEENDGAEEAPRAIGPYRALINSRSFSAIYNASPN